MEYVWEKEFIISAKGLTGEITVTGTPEIGYPQQITVTIASIRTTDTTGTLKVQILKDETVVDTLEAGLAVTVPANNQWTKQYEWVARETGSYKIKATFIES